MSKLFTGQQDRVPRGGHVSALCHKREEQITIVVEYFRVALSRGQRCMYICGDYSIPEVRELFQDNGIDVAREESRGALLLDVNANAHLLGGTFDPDRMIELLERSAGEALQAGFTGLCAAGDMSWILQQVPGTERLAEYESRLNGFCRTHNALVLCLYNRSSLPSDVLDHALATHRHVCFTAPTLVQNPFYEDDYRSMHREAAEPDIVAEKLDILDATALTIRLQSNDL